jgi:hypothetical protein
MNQKGNLDMPRQRDHRVDLFALFGPSLMLLGLMIGHLNFHAYPLLTPESLIVLIAFAAFGIILGLIPALLGPTNLRAFLLGMLLLFFLDLQFGWNVTFRNLFVVDHGLPWWAFFIFAFVAGTTAFWIILSMREHIATIIFTFFGVFFLGVLLIPGPSNKFGAEGAAESSEVSSNDPLIIYLILDSHQGIEGIPLDLPGGPETRETLLRFYEKWGFRTFGGAYSPYLMTLNSVAYSLNGAASDKDLLYIEHGQRIDRAYRLTENKYFRAVLKSKRKIRVFQSDYVDFCADAQAPVEYCFTYPTSSVHSLVGAKLAPLSKARIIIDSYLRRENVSGQLYEFVVTQWFHSSIAVPEIFNVLGDDIVANPRGNLFFGHLMLPHDPYVWDRQCQIRPNAASWTSRRPDHTDLTTIGTPEYRVRAYADYFDQVHCVVQLLDDMLMTIDKAGLLQDATIIIHGDHGSRITLRDPIIANRNQATIIDYVDSFSTLFAIRSPELEPGYSSQLQPLPNLIAEHLFRIPAPMDKQTVYLRNDSKLEGLDLLSVPMPDF